jgi:histidinol-phosphate aminotransferase
VPKIKSHLEGLYRSTPEQRLDNGFLRLDMNEGLPGLPERFLREALSEIGPEFMATYPEYDRLRERLAHHNNLSPNNICLSPGSDGAVKYLFDAYVSPGDKVLLTDPTFAMYPVYCDMFQAKPVSVEYNHDLSFPRNRFLESIDEGIRLAVIVNPNNPTGTAEEPEHLAAIVEHAVAHDVLVVVDEAYFYFYPKTIVQHVKEYKNLVVLRTFSKLFCMASARLGYAIAAPEVIDHLTIVKPTYDVNGVAVRLAERLIETPSLVRELIGAAAEGKRFLVEKLAGEAIAHRTGEANFVLLNCGERVPEIARRLAERKILVRAGFRQVFLKEYLRVTIGTRAVMEAFWEAFVAIWRDPH